MADPKISFDVLGVGCAAVDDFVYVDSYPDADAKVPIRRQERQCGGLTTTALVAASRLGAQCAYAGVLGDDDLSRFIVRTLEREGIDVSHLIRRPEVRPVYCVIIVDGAQHTRTIFFDQAGWVGPDTELPAEEVIRSSRVLFIDDFGEEGMVRAARVARAAGVPRVADFERGLSPVFPELLSLTDHLIISRAFGGRLTGEEAPDRIVKGLLTPDRQVVVITAGSEGCWFTSSSQPDLVRHQPAFRVSVVDTTGCGDVFHGAYAAALPWEPDLEKRVRFATAAAALKATRPGGQSGIPTRSAVEEFLKEQSP